MADATLILTTAVGLRPLGVRGEPLHATQAQIRSVIRRRLGERHANLLAVPQHHDQGGAIDWYAEADGEVRNLAALESAARGQADQEIDSLLADINGLADELIATDTSEARILGRALQLAVRRPPDGFAFMVGDQPVLAAWGYESDALPMVFAPPRLPIIAPPVVVGSVAMAPRAFGNGAWRWASVLLAGLLLLLLLLGSSWLLRSCVPVEPEVAVERLPAPPAPPAPEPPYDPTPSKQATLASLRDAQEHLKADLLALEKGLDERRAQCPPPKREEPKLAVAPQPKPEPPKPVKKADLPEDRWKKGDVTMLEGCWVLGRDSQTTMTTARGTMRGINRAGRMCFGRNGSGTRQSRAEFQGHPQVVCEAPINVRFGSDGAMHTTQPQVRCNPSSVTWHSEPNWLTCRRVSDTVALCRDGQGFEHEFRREGGR